MRAPQGGRDGPRGAAERRERARGAPRGTPEEIGAGGSLVEIEGFRRGGGGALRLMEILFWMLFVRVAGGSLGMFVWRGFREASQGG